MVGTFYAVLPEPLECGESVAFRRPVHRRGGAPFIAVLVQPFHLSRGRRCSSKAGHGGTVAGKMITAEEGGLGREGMQRTICC